MKDHYYSHNPSSESEERKIETVLRGNKLVFTTDRGVFSKGEVDFGTQTLLDAFEWPEAEGAILDVGCGYGPIGLTLAAEKKRDVWMVDVNQRALGLAKRNAKDNQINNVTIKESDLLDSVKKQDFSAIVTNPPIRAGKKVVHELFKQTFNHLLPDGELWVVIQKKQGAPSAKERLEEIFESVETVKKNKGYYILKAKK
ncbi:class I SAM-dependent methyltransferase [Bacillus sp. FJAT-44742]|uniref:class I SAM-dependent methyltransferase n=1 Tax=Bacillus sp. FJAT-44742 TaxID=2014005 RepID=UPI000C243CA0|nr:class I SAM-dependent methyltransferase [Bacillus sp. FJAT-44742]